MKKRLETEVTVLRYGEDNLAYLLRNGETGNGLVVDPGCAETVLTALSRLGLRPERLLATHRHADHTAGAAEISRRTGCPPLDLDPPSGEILWSGGRLTVLAVPGHTREDVAFLDVERKALFTGDTLFVAGCGRLFGGGAETMWRSLERLAALPESLRVYPGHDYTAENLAFAAHLVPGDPVVAERLERARAGDPLVPSSIGTERRTNPFLRCADPEFRARLGLAGASASEAFAELRRRKDRW